MPRFFVLEVPDRLPKNEAEKAVAYLRGEMAKCGIEAAIVVLDEGWRLTEVYTDAGTVDVNGGETTPGDSASAG